MLACAYVWRAWCQARVIRVREHLVISVCVSRGCAHACIGNLFGALESTTEARELERRGWRTISVRTTSAHKQRKRYTDIALRSTYVDNHRKKEVWEREDGP